MTEPQEFCLRWNDFHSNFHLSLDALRGDESFTDVTLSCSGRLIKAHRVILSACSVHFKEILRGIPGQQHPVIVLPTVDYEVMQAIMEFIYQGQVNVKRTQLGAFLQVAETFSIQGLADDDTKKNAAKTSGRSRGAPAEQDPPPAKRRRPDPPPSGASVPAKAAAPPSAGTAGAVAQHTAAEAQLPADVEEQEQSADGDDGGAAHKLVNIKSERLADAMVGELLDHSATGEMLDPDMEPGSDVVAQAMATIEHESSVDTPANGAGDGDGSVATTGQLGTGATGTVSTRLLDVWQHFVQVADQVAMCRACSGYFRYHRTSFSNLKRHLARRHPDIYHMQFAVSDSYGPVQLNPWVPPHTPGGGGL